MRIGTALEDLAASEYDGRDGPRVRRHRAMVQHPDIPWAAASPDAQVDRRAAARGAQVDRQPDPVRRRLPQDVEAQVAWQLGCVGDAAWPTWPSLTDDALTVYEQPADPALFADLVAVAADFRRRLAEGGPFARDDERIRRDYPADDGTEIAADADTAEAVRALLDIRARIARMEADEKRLKAAIEARMGDAAVMTGPGFRVVVEADEGPRRSTDWRAIADDAARTTARDGARCARRRHVIVRAGHEAAAGDVRQGDGMTDATPARHHAVHAREARARAAARPSGSTRRHPSSASSPSPSPTATGST